MTYTIVVPADLVHKMYLCREAGMTKSIRGFIIAAIELKLQGFNGDFLKEEE